MVKNRFARSGSKSHTFLFCQSQSTNEKQILCLNFDHQFLLVFFDFQGLIAQPSAEFMINVLSKLLLFL